MNDIRNILIELNNVIDNIILRSYQTASFERELSPHEKVDILFIAQDYKDKLNGDYKIPDKKIIIPPIFGTLIYVYFKEKPQDELINKMKQIEYHKYYPYIQRKPWAFKACDADQVVEIFKNIADIDPEILDLAEYCKKIKRGEINE